MVNMVDLMDIIPLAYIFLPILFYLFLFTLYLFLILSKNSKEGCTKSFSWFFLIFLLMQTLSDFFVKLQIYFSLMGIPYNPFIYILLMILYAISVPVSLLGYIVLFFGIELKLFSKKTKFIYSITSTLFYLFMSIIFVISFLIIIFYPISGFEPYYAYQMTYHIIYLIEYLILAINPLFIGLTSIILLLIFLKKNPSFGIFSIYLILGIVVLFIIAPLFEFTYHLLRFLRFNEYIFYDYYDPIHYYFIGILPYISDLIKPFGALLLSMGAYLTSVVPLNVTKNNNE